MELNHSIYLKDGIKIRENTGYITSSVNLACFNPIVKSFGIKPFFYAAFQLGDILSPNI